jgi:hypothetical protein
MGTIDVVEATNSELNTEVLAVVLAELLRGELLQSISILGIGGPGIGLLEAGVGGIKLLEFGVDAGRGGVEESLNSGATSGLGHVESAYHQCRRVSGEEASNYGSHIAQNSGSASMCVSPRHFT